MALRGVISKIRDDKVVVHFENLSRISERELEDVTFEFEVGNRAIGEDLNIWE